MLLNSKDPLTPTLSSTAAAHVLKWYSRSADTAVKASVSFVWIISRVLTLKLPRDAQSLRHARTFTFANGQARLPATWQSRESEQ